MPKYTAEEVIGAWDRNAEKAAAFSGRYGDRNKEVLLTPRVLDWLGEIHDLEVLDAGCGEGFLSRLMSELGARVTGIDFSHKILEISRERTRPELNINFRHLNLENLDIIKDASFDLIVSLLTLQDLPDYQAALRELYRVLKLGGRFYLAITHPCFTSDGSWGRDSQGEKLHWKIDRYFFEREVEMRMDPNSDDNPIGFHRTLSSYFRAIRNAGFSILDLIEPTPSQEAIEKDPHFEDDLRMCHFIVFDLEK